MHDLCSLLTLTSLTLSPYPPPPPPTPPLSFLPQAPVLVVARSDPPPPFVLGARKPSFVTPPVKNGPGSFTRAIVENAKLGPS